MRAERKKSMNNYLSNVDAFGDTHIDGECRYASQRRRKNAVKASSRCHIGIVVYQLIAMAVLLIVEFGLFILLPEYAAVRVINSPYYLWVMQVLAMYVIAFPIFHLMTKGIPTRRAEKKDITLGEFTVVFMIAQGLAVVGSIISTVLTDLIEGTTNTPIEDTTSQIISSSPLWLIILVVVIIGPIIEELMFRKIFIDKLSVYGDRLAIIVSGVAFGFMHGNLYQLFYAVAIGILFGYVYVKTRKIICTCLLHIMVNFFGSVPGLLMEPAFNYLTELETLYPDGVGMSAADMLTSVDALVGVYSYLFLQYGLAIAGIVLLIVLSVKKAYKVPDSCEYRLPKKTVPRVAFFNLGAIIFFIWSAIFIILTIFPNALNILLNRLIEAIGA